MSHGILDELVSPGPTAVAAIGLLLFACWCFWHRRVDHTLAALALYLGLLDGYLKLRTGSPFITLGRDVLVAAIAVGVLLRAMHSRERLQLPPLGGFVLAFSVIVVVELFNPNGRGAGLNLAGVRQHLEFVPLFFLGYAFMRRESQLHKLLVILVVCAAAGGVVSYVQSTLTPAELAGWGPGYSARIYGQGVFAGAGRVAFDETGLTSVRPFGLGSDIGAGAGFAALALPALIALLVGARGRLRLAMVAAAIGVGLAIVTAGSRAGVVTVFVSLVAFGLIAASSRNALRAIAALAVAAILVYGISQELGVGNSAAQRNRSLDPTSIVSSFSKERGGSAALLGEYVSKYPLGIGVGTVGPARAFGSADPFAQPLNAETQWNFLVLEVGVLGLVIFIAMNVRLLSLALTRIRRLRASSLRLKLAALSAPLVGLIVAGFAGPTTVSVPSAPYFWFVAGVLSYWLVVYSEPAPGGAEIGTDRDYVRRAPPLVHSRTSHAPAPVKLSR